MFLSILFSNRPHIYIHTHTYIPLELSVLYLHEVGRVTRFNAFTKSWMLIRENKSRLESEMVRIRRKSDRTAEKRLLMSDLDRVTIELHEAFTIVAEITRLNKPREDKPQEDDLMALAFGGGDGNDEEDDYEEYEEEEVRKKYLIFDFRFFTYYIQELDEEALAEAEERRSALAAQEAMGFGVASYARNKKYKRPPDLKERPPEDVIGRYGFRRLILDGELLGEKFSIQVMDHLFDSIDHDKNGIITFYDFWDWYFTIITYSLVSKLYFICFAKIGSIQSLKSIT